MFHHNEPYYKVFNLRSVLKYVDYIAAPKKVNNF